MMRSGRVVIASTRAAAGVYEDRTGPIIVDWLNQRASPPRRPLWSPTALTLLPR